MVDDTLGEEVFTVDSIREMVEHSLPDSVKEGFEAFLSQYQQNRERLVSEIESNDSLRSELSKVRSRHGMTFRIHEERALSPLRNGSKFPVLRHRHDYDTIQNPGEMDHALIEADNAFSMMILNSLWYRRPQVDVIYADPPYNTLDTGKSGSAFVYNDKRVDIADTFSHSKWLSFMLVRLTLMQQLLKPTGVIMVAIGKQERNELGMLMDAVFGSNNSIDMVTWAGGNKNDGRFFAGTSDYMFVYAKSKATLVAKGIQWRKPKSGVEEIVAAGNSAWEGALSQALAESGAHDGFDGDDSAAAEFVDALGGTARYAIRYRAGEIATARLKTWWKANSKRDSVSGSKHYNRIDGFSGRVFFPGDISAQSGVGKTDRQYEVSHPLGGNVPAPARGFPAQRTMREWMEDERVHFGADNSSGVNVKRFIDETDEEIEKDVIYADRRSASQELKKMMGLRPDGSVWFNNPKNVEVIEHYIELVTPAYRRQESLNGGAPIVVLDPFAGSGTTGHAVFRLNAKGNGLYRAILLTNNEDPTAKDDDPTSGVARDVTSVRLRAALTGKWDSGDVARLPGNLHYYDVKWTRLHDDNDPDGIRSFARDWSAMLGFKHNAHGVLEGKDTEDYSVISAEDGTLIFVWQNTLTVDNNEFYVIGDAMAEVRAKYAGRPAYLSYIPVADSIDEAYAIDSVLDEVAGWKVAAYPHDYVANYRKVRLDIVANTFPTKEASK